MSVTEVVTGSPTDPIPDAYRLLERPAWHADALCHGDTGRMYPVRGRDTADVVARCFSCPAQGPCLVAGLARAESGIWGGLNERQRVLLRRRLRAARTRSRPQPAAGGGTYSTTGSGCGRQPVEERDEFDRVIEMIREHAPGCRGELGEDRGQPVA